MSEHIKMPPVPGRKPPAPFRFSLVDENLKDFIKRNEREIYHFYKDTEDKITIGYGQMIPNVEEAKKLPLYKFEGKNPIRPATRQEIEDAYYKVKERPFGQNISALDFDPGNRQVNLPNIGLQKQDMEFMLETTLRQNIDRLRTEFPDFHTYPPGPRKGLADLEYNLGPSKFVRTNIEPEAGKEKGWPKLFDAVDKRDWKAAADESRRSTKGLEARNEEIRKAFLDGLWQDKKKR